MLRDAGQAEVLTLLWATDPALSPAELVTHTHEYLAQPSLLPRREDQDASKVVVIPTHLLLREETDHLLRSRLVSIGQRRGAVWTVVDEEVVVE